MCGLDDHECVPTCRKFSDEMRDACVPSLGFSHVKSRWVGINGSVVGCVPGVRDGSETLCAGSTADDLCGWLDRR